MEGETSSIKCFGNRTLCQLINGTGVLRPQELVERELKRNKERIVSGLTFYRKPVCAQGELIKGKKLPKVTEDFILKISVFLGLDELQSYELFSSFLSSDYRGSKKELQYVVCNERLAHTLVYKIRDYYFTERLYLLQCIKVIINSWQNHVHPFQVEFEKFVKSKNVTDGTFLKKLIDMLQCLSQEPYPTWETNSTLMNSRQLHTWAQQNLREQCEILEILLIYAKDFDLAENQVMTLLDIFKHHGFGRLQNYKHIIDETLALLVKRIGYLEVLIFLETMDLELMYLCTGQGSFEDHYLLKEQESFLKLDKILQSYGSEEAHGPMMLLWSAVHMLIGDGSDFSMARKFGNAAVHLHVFHYIHALLKSDPFTEENSLISSVSHHTVYNLLVIILSTFDENTLGNDQDLQVMYRVICLVLKQISVAEDFWEKGIEEGVGGVFHASLLRFPLDYNSFVQFSCALAASSPSSAERIFHIWRQLQRYTEYLDCNHSSDLMSTKETNEWKLAVNKIPYPGKDFILNAGTRGKILSMGTKHDASPIIQWYATYSGWDLLLCEVEVLLDQVAHGSGMVSPTQIGKVTEAIDLVHAVLQNHPQCIQEFEPIIHCIYLLIHRFARLSQPPVTLIVQCIDCLTCLALTDPLKVWHNMKQTGLLPYLTENVDNIPEILSGQGLMAGRYGTLLFGQECIEGLYPVTKAILEFISTFIEPFFKESKENELMASIMYILREVFPAFQKWRFYNIKTREAIGRKCLDIFHKILTNMITRSRPASKRPQLQDVCVYSLLFTEAGQTLLGIIATGSDSIDLALIQQGSMAEEGVGSEMIKLIQISFSVLNQLLLLKSPDLPISPVESALSSQPVVKQNQHIIATIAQYIYHRHNPTLPMLACLLLKRLALVSKMSILSCLGGAAESVRDMYLNRLQGFTEDLRLKVAILEFLSVCVEAQPGLIEIFLNVKSMESSSVTNPTATANRKDLSLGKTSCLQTVLKLMEADKQMTYQCPPDLLCACMDFIHSLWTGHRETAMSVLRKCDKFWLSVCAPLTRDSTSSEEDEGLIQVSVSHQMKTISYVLEILAEEIYCVTSGKLDEKLKKILEDLSRSERLKYWSVQIRECLVTESEKNNEASDNLVDHYTLKLLIAWKNFLITVAKLQVQQIKVDNHLKEVIIFDLIEGLHALINGHSTALNIKLSQITSALVFKLVKLWTSSLTVIRRTVKEVQASVVEAVSGSAVIIPSLHIGMLGSLVAMLQHIRLSQGTSLDPNTLRNVFETTCEVIHHSIFQLPSPKDLSTNNKSAEVWLKMQVVSCCLLEEVILQMSGVESWLPLLQQNLIISSLLSSAEVFIKGKQGLNYVHTVMLLFLTIAKHEKGAESLALSGLTQHLCLSVLHLYEDFDSRKQTAILTTKQQESVHSPSWNGVYCLCIDLYSTVLSLLKFSFLEDAFHFLGTHQDKMLQCFELSKVCVHDAVLFEAEKTCDFIKQLSYFLPRWRMTAAASVAPIQNSMLYMCQTFIAYLMRPRYLQHILENKSQGSQEARRLQQQSSVEEVDTPSNKLLSVQKRMLEILGRSLSTLRSFTPDLCEILYERNMDYAEYQPFLHIVFTGPSTDQECLPSFGTLTSCVRDVCVRFLTKYDTRAGQSPHQSQDSNIADVIPKSLVLFVMENALYIIMSQSIRYLRDPGLVPTDKQLLKRELGTEMNYFLMELQRYIKRGAPSSPNTSLRQTSPRVTSGTPVMLGRSLSQTGLMSTPEMEFFKFVQEFVSTVLK